MAFVTHLLFRSFRDDSPKEQSGKTEWSPGYYQQLYPNSGQLRTFAQEICGQAKRVQELAHCIAVGVIPGSDLPL